MGDIYAANNYCLSAEDISHGNALEDFWKRSDQQRKTKEFLAANRDKLGLKNAKSMVSVGPSIGEIDSYLISVCAPNVSEYYGVEPSDNHSVQLRRRLEANNPGVKKVHIVKQLSQDWTGPSSPVDVVLLFHVLYYIPHHEKKEFLARCRRWLADGGTMAIAINKETDFTRDLQKVCLNHNASGDIRQVLHELRYPFEEYEFETTIDLRGPYEEFAELVFDRRASPEEVEHVENCCKMYIEEPDHYKQTLPVVLFVLRKNSQYAMG